jgi:predicted GNAT superfamily acetyltransferase
MDEIRIRPARDAADFEACCSLQRAVWGLSDLDITSSIQLIATTHAGGSVLMAESLAGQPMGFAYAFPAMRGCKPHLHSDMLAVLPDYQRRGVGVRLKWAQREDALARGVTLVTWTFDPLQARNAHLNLRRLGARATALLPNFYGITSSALHHGLPTDRLLVEWELDAARVAAQAGTSEPPPVVPAPDAPRVNDVRWQAGWAVSSEPRLDLDNPTLLLEIPPDFDVLHQSAPNVAEDWHGKVRRGLQAYLERGYLVSDFAPTEERGRRRPFYVLTRESS